MNLVEGIRRIYIVLFALLTIAYVASQWDDFPNVNQTAAGIQFGLKDEVLKVHNATHDEKLERHQIDYGDLTPEQFIESACKKVSLQSAGLVKICADYRTSIDDLPQRRVQYIGVTVGSALAIALGGYLLWILLAWIGRGFLANRTT